MGALILLLALGAIWYLGPLHRFSHGPSAGRAPETVDLLPDAPVVAYIDVASLRRLQGSMVAAILGLAGESPAEDRDYQDFVRDTGFDYTRDLDHAAIAFWPATNNQTVAIAEGRFDVAKIKAYALRTGRSVADKSRSFILVPGNPPVAFQFLSPTQLELASGPGADRFLSPSPRPERNPEMQTRILRVAGAPIFAAARTDNLPSSFYDQLRGTPEFEHLARSIRGITLAGQPEGDVIHLALDGECASIADTLELATAIDGIRVLGPLALSDPKTRSKMTKEQFLLISLLLSQVKVSHEDRWVRLTLDLSPEMLGQPARGPNAELFSTFPQ